VTARLRMLADDPDAERLIDALAPGMHEAGNPFLDWMFGDGELARTAVRRWMASERSEIAIRRVTVLEDDDVIVGAFVGVDGADMPGCARADSVVAMAVAGRAGRAVLLQRAATLAKVRRPVALDQWLLSKLWVSPAHRGCGLGRALAREFVAQGERRGLRRCRVDARIGDAHVIRLYESVGFEQRARSAETDPQLAVVEMVRES